MIFEAMIADDEAPARVELRNQLEDTGRVKVVAEAVISQTRPLPYSKRRFPRWSIRP